MAVETLGDVRVTYPDNITPNRAVAITHFMDEGIGVLEANQNPFAGMIKVTPIAGDKMSIPRALGVSEGRKVASASSDRSFRASATDHVRKNYTYGIYDLDFEIKHDETNANQINMSADIMRRIVGFRARVGVQTILTALGALPSVNSSDRAQDGVLATIASQVKWDAVNKVRKFDGDGVGWNSQKLSLIRTVAMQGNNSMGIASGCIIASPLTVDGFSQDEQSANNDYRSSVDRAFNVGNEWSYMPNFGGYKWALVPEYPDALDGTKQGIVFTTTAVNGSNVDLGAEYVVDPMQLFYTTSSERSMYELEIYEDYNSKSTRFRFSAYIGAGVLNPKGVIKINNAATTTGYSNS